jgi:hypothetical protein
MTDSADARLLRRFLTTVRVATATALAEYELTAGRASAAAPVVFRALAAKGADGWRFPAAGIEAADGLVHAALERDEAGAPARLVLQAQGSAGLSAYAGRRVAIAFGPLGPDATAAFDAGGRASIDLAPLGLDEDELAAFDLTVEEE